MRPQWMPSTPVVPDKDAVSIVTMAGTPSPAQRHYSAGMPGYRALFYYPGAATSCRLLRLAAQLPAPALVADNRHDEALV